MRSKRPLIVRVTDRVLRPLGYEAVPRGRWNAIPVERRPRTLIDIGCATDTPQFRNAFPGARLLLIDPVAEYEPQMKAAVERRGGAYAIAAVGAESGTITFHVNVDDPEKSSLYERTALAAKAGRVEERNCPVETLDALVARHGAEPPFGVKIDTEGHELQVIAGAEKTLRESVFVITETSVQPRFVGSYRFEQLIRAMEDRGFRVRNVLSAEPDGEGLVRSLDVLFAPVDDAVGTG